MSKQNGVLAGTAHPPIICDVAALPMNAPTPALARTWAVAAAPGWWCWDER